MGTFMTSTLLIVMFSTSVLRLSSVVNVGGKWWEGSVGFFDRLHALYNQLCLLVHVLLS